MSDRPNALEVLAHHWPKPLASCLCGWAELGKSHSGHQVEMLRAAVGATEGQPVVILGDGTLTVAEQAAAWDPPDEVDCDCPETATWCPECGGTGRLYYDGPAVLFEDEPHPDGCVPLWRIPGAES